MQIPRNSKREDVCEDDLKRMVKKEYFEQVRAVLKSSLNSGNIINALNAWAVPAVRYGARLMIWTKEELARLE